MKSLTKSDKRVDNQDQSRSWAHSRSITVAIFLAVATIFVWAGPARSSTIPTITVSNVVTDTSVTIVTHDFPANQNFTVTMGKMGTRGEDGNVVGTINSGAGGSLTATYNIPSELAGERQIAIRLQTAHAHPFYAFNWFYNNTAGTGGVPPTPPAGPTEEAKPTFSVCSVVRNGSVTINTKDFPPNQTFTVTMGPMGTQGIGGQVVGTLNSGVGGALTATFDIPSQVANLDRISIRMQTAGAHPYYAYNWFFNTTATVC